MYLAWLTTLRKVVEEGSYTRAAANLLISQSAASQHVQHLEKQFGAKLIYWVGRDLRLTDAGREVYDLACRFTSDVTATQERVDDLTGRARRTLTIVSSAAALLHLLPPVIRRFCAEEPSVTVRTLMRTGREINDALRTGMADLAVQTALSRDFRLEGPYETVPIRDEPIVPVCTPDNANALGDPADVIALSRRRVAFGVGNEIATLISEWFEARGAKLRNVMQLSSSEESRIAALEDLAVSFLPQYVVARELAAGELVRLELQDFSVTRTTFVIYPQEAQVYAAQFAKMLQDANRLRLATTLSA
jgi:DNA-binding transcriptional LysR family regulator